MFTAIVYFLCVVTSVACATLLLRSYVEKRTRILLWIGLSFVLIAINNLLVFTDVIVWPSADLLPLRRLSSVAAAAVLVVGLSWEAE